VKCPSQPLGRETPTRRSAFPLFERGRIPHREKRPRHTEGLILTPVGRTGHSPGRSPVGGKPSERLGRRRKRRVRYPSQPPTGSLPAARRSRPERERSFLRGYTNPRSREQIYEHWPHRPADQKLAPHGSEPQNRPGTPQPGDCPGLAERSYGLKSKTPPRVGRSTSRRAIQRSRFAPAGRERRRPPDCASPVTGAGGIRRLSLRQPNPRLSSKHWDFTPPS
jgi:hypothetical protein